MGCRYFVGRVEGNGYTGAMRELLRLTVPPAADGLTVRDFLRRWHGVSRTLLTRLKKFDGIWVNGESRWSIDPVHAGDTVVLYLREEPSAVVAPEPVPLDIAYEDQDVLVVNKPAGLVVHPARGYRTGTLANGVARHLEERGIAAPVRPISRLDMDTSGLIAFACNPWAHDALAGRLERGYLAVVTGQVVPAAGTVDAPIRQIPGHPVKREVHPEGQPARTHFRVAGRFAGATLIEVRLETGRTHQIRVHMVHLGHPLLGDELYGGARDRIARQALHAGRLAFVQPRTGAPVALSAPPPPDLQGLLERLAGGPETPGRPSPAQG